MILLSSMTIFCVLDYFLNFFGFKGNYYLIHFFLNLFVIYTTLPELLLSYYYPYQEGLHILSTCNSIIGLHLYHIIWYYNKLRFDDWLHHILMIFVVMPLSIVLEGGYLLGHGLFFLTGLPGCIDYLLLFLVRNDMLEKHTEKYYNRLINLWIRCPGCIATSTLILLQNNKREFDLLTYIISWLVSLLVFWNGIYFMEQVVSDYAIKYKKN